MQVARRFPLGFKTGSTQSVAVSYHTLRSVKFHHMGKLFFPAAEGLKFCHEPSRKRKRKEGRKSWYRKQPLIWVLLWKCFALEAPTLLSICLSSHGNHSNKQQCISLEVFKEMNLVFLKYAPFSAYKGIEVERKNVGI